MSDILDRLRSLDSCVVSDALDRHQLHGAVTGIVPLTSVRRVAGRVVTVELVPAGSSQVPAAPRHLATAAVASAGRGDVIVVAHPGGTMAGWGGLLSLAASERRIEGTLIDGGCRDVDEAIELGYGIFARSATPITARGRLVERDWGQPIEFAGVSVSSGDLVLADSSGVVFLPAGAAESIVSLASELAAREQAMAAAVRAGRAVTEVMGASYEELAGAGVNHDH